MIFSCTLFGLIASTILMQSVAAFKCAGEVSYLRVGQEVEGWTLGEVDGRYAVMLNAKESFRLMVGGDSSGAVDFAIGSFQSKGDTLVVTPALQKYIADEGLLTIIMQAASEPVVGPDGIVGYRLFDIDRGSAFELAGIREGDVITEIDGDRLTNPVVALMALKRLRYLKKFTFKYLRDGAEGFRAVEVR